MVSGLVTRKLSRFESYLIFSNSYGKLFYKSKWLGTPFSRKPGKRFGTPSNVSHKLTVRQSCLLLIGPLKRVHMIKLNYGVIGCHETYSRKRWRFSLVCFVGNSLWKILAGLSGYQWRQVLNSISAKFYRTKVH